MVDSWRTSTWGDEISLEYGKALRGYETSGGAYRVFGSNGPIGWTAKPLVQGPGVILGRKGVYRGVEYSRDPFFVIDTAYYVVPKTDLNMRWLYYAIKHYKLGDVDDGSPIPSTTRAAVYMLNLEVPHPDEQRAVGDILGVLDDKINLNFQISETLETLVRAIFKDWFVDFGPVRAKQSGSPCYLPEAIWSCFPDSLGQEGNPSGWQSKHWQDLASLEYGKRLEGYQNATGNVPVFGTNGQIGWHDTALSLEPGVIIGRKGAYRGVHYCDSPFYVIDTAFFLKAKVSYSRRWAYYSISQYDINSMDSGSAIPSTSREDFYKIEVIEPPLAVQTAFDELLNPLWARQKSNRAEADTLVQLRDTLLPKLISGEIRLREAERLIERVV